MADRIGDLGAGRFEYIVDIGICAFAAARVSLAPLTAQHHMGGSGWSIGIVGLALLA